MPKQLILTLKQVALLRRVDEKKIYLASNRDNWDYQFFDQNEKVFKPSMMKLLRLQLVRFSYKDGCFVSTKLGEKLAKLARKKEKETRKPATIVGLLPTKNQKKWKQQIKAK